MPQSLAQIHLHLVFSTKGRVGALQNRALRDETLRYLGGTCNNLECPAVCVGGVADHVHVLCLLNRTIAVARLVQELKRESSTWLRGKDPSLADFHWQNGYGAFSISRGHVGALRKYIENQELHHATKSFQDELRRLLKKHDLAWDERYVWD
jgi:REP element-mobilizing transposase RayT